MKLNDGRLVAMLGILLIGMFTLSACQSAGKGASDVPAPSVALDKPSAASPTLSAVVSPPEGTMVPGRFRSNVLGEEVYYYVYLPAGYEGGQERYPAIYLLHGRGSTMAEWARIGRDLDRLAATGEIPPMIAVMPDAPWSQRASYFVDSAYTGPDPGRPVETAFITELIPHVDATYRTIADRSGRAAAGYSMGGYGALRYALVHADLFIGAIVLSPAVYVPFPPADSSTREFGAFGVGERLFDEETWTARNYPAAAEVFVTTGLKSYLFIAVGDDEYKHPNPSDRLHDLDMEAHMAFNYLYRVPNLSVELRVLDGGHDWSVWRAGFIEGIRYLAKHMK